MDQGDNDNFDDNEEEYPKKKKKTEDDNDNFDDIEEESPKKKKKTEWLKNYSGTAVQMMQRMGYQDDKGLGKANQGRLEPIIAVQQDGRRGLGHKVPAADENSSSQWDPSLEIITIPEEVTWIENEMTFSYNLEDMRDWIHIDIKKKTMENEIQFCIPEILHDILEAKSYFNNLPDIELRRARSRCNQFETIRSSIFLNRAAVKMANIDSMLDWMFTNPKYRDGTPLVKEYEILYFADICAGPGGFSEYVLYRKGWEAKGFGFTLKDSNDFKLDKFFAGSPESFDPYYGVNNDGNIFFTENQDSFADYIHKHTNEGVHFVMADGGFSVEGEQSSQEILSQQLYLCQCLTALKILRDKGSFVCKLFDVFTPFSVGLIYLMYQSFEQIAIIKPNSSRPANSERYIVGKWKKKHIDDIILYLDHVNYTYSELSSTNSDVNEIVPLDLIFHDEKFRKFIFDSNNKIGGNQIIGLKKIAEFSKNADLKETRQAEFRKTCLQLWNLPDKLRQAPEIKTTDKFLEELLSDWYQNKEFLRIPQHELNSMPLLQNHVKSIHDWYFVPFGRQETSLNTCSIFMCKTRGNLVRYVDKKWDQVEPIFEISPKSLFYGEIVCEFSGEGKTQTRVNALHIIDAMVLGGIDIRRRKLRDRIRLCHKFAQSLNKPYKDGNVGIIRSKVFYKMTQFQQFFNDMRQYTLKNNTCRLGLSLGNDKFYVPGGILLFNEISHNFFSVMSRSRRQLYYFDKMNNCSYYNDNIPNDVAHILFSSFRNSFQRRLIWKWTSIKQVEENVKEKEDKILYRDDFQCFISNTSN